MMPRLHRITALIADTVMRDTQSAGIRDTRNTGNPSHRGGTSMRTLPLRTPNTTRTARKPAREAAA